MRNNTVSQHCKPCALRIPACLVELIQAGGSSILIHAPIPNPTACLRISFHVPRASNYKATMYSFHVHRYYVVLGQALGENPPFHFGQGSQRSHGGFSFGDPVSNPCSFQDFFCVYLPPPRHVRKRPQPKF